MTDVRTYHPRRGRLSARHHDALGRLRSVYGVPPASTVDPVAIFGRPVPLVLEIGSGMGEATVAMAAADPDRGYLAAEIHTPGVANLLALVEKYALDNVRVVDGDALDLLRYGVAPDSLDAVHVFFPDPWPKKRHHKRRLIQPRHVALIRSRLAPGGRLHCATDDAGYAAAMLDTLRADPGLANVYDSFAQRATHRPVTKFEERAKDCGRPVFDLVFHRIPIGAGRSE